MAPPAVETLSPQVDTGDICSIFKKRLNIFNTPERLVVSPISSTLIRPAVPTQPHFISLSNLDLLVLPVYSTLILLYRGAGRDDEQRDRLACLKRSLSKVLVEFYPMAGRLVLDRNRPSIHCNDDGVVWKETTANVELAMLEDYHPVQQLLGVPVNEAGPGPFYPARRVKGVPVLAIQATLFKCGGISLSLAWHHSVADGKSGFSFLRSWTEVSRGEPISVLPSHDRSLLQPSLLLVPSAPPPGYIVHEGGPPPTKLGEEKAKPIDLGSTSGMVLRKILFSKERVDALKKEASSSETTTFSSAVCVSAHLWKVLTVARKLDGDHLTHFSLTVDGRKCINLPDNYFGNALSWATAECRARDLLDEPLSSAARLIHDGIRRSRSVEAYQWLIDAVEIHGPQSVRFAHQSCFGQDVGATFWTQMRLYELDFGWGTPIHGSRNVIPVKALDGLFAVMPCGAQHGEPGSLLVLAYLNSEIADRLCSSSLESFLHPDLTQL